MLLMFPPRHPPLTPHITAHRIAVSNIAVCFRVTNDPVPFTLAILNDNARRRGSTEFGAIGGGALITPLGMLALQTVAPIDFELHDDGVQHDARMTLRSEGIETRRVLALRTLIQWARLKKHQFIELDITRELEEELVDDAPAIISRTDLMSIHSRLIGWKLGTKRQSSRGEPGVTTTPLYFCHELVFEDARVFAKLLSDPQGRVRWIDSDEIRTTRTGKSEGVTRHGYTLFSNVFAPETVRPF